MLTRKKIYHRAHREHRGRDARHENNKCFPIFPVSGLCALCELCGKFFLFFLLLTGCSSATNCWRVDSIAAGDQVFNSSRLRHLSSQSHPLLAFEMVKMGDQIESYLSLSRFRFTPDEENLTKILFTIDDLSFEDLAPLHEGRMKLRLSQETTKRLILALKEGKKVRILVDDFEETLNPEQFSRFLDQFMGEASFFEDLFKGAPE